MAGAVILPVTGLSVGVVQVCRGIINQPEAIAAAHQGKLWDPVRRGCECMRVHACACVCMRVHACIPYCVAVCRGILNQPEVVAAAHQGKLWTR